MNNNISRSGILFVVSAPSGAGKTTLCDNLRVTPDFVYSVSCTTRAPRPGEIDSEDYFFLDRATFGRRVAQGDFLEHAEVHTNFYGTPKDNVLKYLTQGIDVLIDVDTAGADQIRATTDPLILSSLVDVFIMPPNLEELRKRLVKRGTESSEQIDIRIANAAREMASWHSYRYTILSESMEEDLQKFRAIMKAERYRSARLNFTLETPNNQPSLPL